jgi:hypothetical protein
MASLMDIPVSSLGSVHIIIILHRLFWICFLQQLASMVFHHVCVVIMVWKIFLLQHGWENISGRGEAHIFGDGTVSLSASI